MESKFKVKVKDEEVLLHFKMPNQKEILALDLEYRKIFSDCVRNGVMTEIEAKKFAEKNNIWTKADQRKLDETSVEIGFLESILANEDGKCTPEDQEKAYEKLVAAREEVMRLINTQVETIENCAENLSSQQRMHLFVILCCVDDNDNKYFKDKSSYEKFAVEFPDALSEIYKQAYFFEFGEPSKLTEDWGEIKFLKKKLAKLAEEEVKKAETIESSNPSQ